MRYNCFEREQPSLKVKNKVKEIIKSNKIEIILSHTCPYKYLPYETFLPIIDKSKVDQTTEIFLDYID